MTTTHPPRDAAPPSLVRRRAVTTGAAWMAPLVVVGVAAPAFAASGCAEASVVAGWATQNYVRNGQQSGKWTSGDLELTVKSVIVGDNLRRGNQRDQVLDNLAVTDVSVGGVGRALTIRQAPKSNRNKGTRANRQEVTFTFNEPVANLSFSITDIDSIVENYSDRVEVTRDGGTAFGGVISDPAAVVGAGTQVAPFKGVDPDADFEDDSSQGRVLVSMPGPTTTFTITYWSSETESNSNDGDQKIYLSALSFTTLCEQPA